MKIVMSAVIALFAFLALAFFDNFVTKAEFSVINVIRNDIRYIKKTQDEIKLILIDNIKGN